MTDAFRTDFNIPKAPFSLSGGSRVLTMGSCFSDVIGNKLQHYKVQTLVNPFGTIFNPVSAGLLLEAAAGQEIDIENRLTERDGIWYAYDLHSSYAAPTPPLLLAEIRKSIAETAEFLKQTDLLILTFGTAIAYKLKDTGEIVANCHKAPANLFDKEMLTPDEIVTAMFSMHAAVKSINPDLKILLTVSPVRHVKETMVVNSASKAALRVACHYLSETLPDVTYFPSFELMMDDLRDYRFYKADMLHPTEVAENYIWQKFTNAYFDEAFRKFMPEWDRISRALSHKPFQPESPAHQRFLKELLQQLETLNQKIDCSLEIKAIREQIIPEPEKTAGKQKKKKHQADRKEKSGQAQTTVAEKPVETTPIPEEAKAATGLPVFAEPVAEITQTEVTTPPQPVAEKPALTEAELEAIANRPIVPAKPWISAKEKAEARKKERAAQQATKQAAKKAKARKKKAPAIASLLSGIKTVAETKPAEQAIPALPIQTVATETVPDKAAASETTVEEIKPASEKPVQEPVVGENKQLAISAFLQGLGAGKPVPAATNQKNKPTKQKPKPKPFAKKQTKTVAPEIPAIQSTENLKPVPENKPENVVPVPEIIPATSGKKVVKPKPATTGKKVKAAAKLNTNPKATKQTKSIKKEPITNKESTPLTENLPVQQPVVVAETGAAKPKKRAYKPRGKSKDKSEMKPKTE